MCMRTHPREVEEPRPSQKTHRRDMMQEHDGKVLAVHLEEVIDRKVDV